MPESQFTRFLFTFYTAALNFLFLQFDSNMP
jgi:hypothetical protein